MKTKEEATKKVVKAILTEKHFENACNCLNVNSKNAVPQTDYYFEHLRWDKKEGEKLRFLAKDQICRVRVLIGSTSDLELEFYSPTEDGLVGKYKTKISKSDLFKFTSGFFYVPEGEVRDIVKEQNPGLLRFDLGPKGPHLRHVGYSVTYRIKVSVEYGEIFLDKTFYSDGFIDYEIIYKCNDWSKGFSFWAKDLLFNLSIKDKIKSKDEEGVEEVFEKNKTKYHRHAQHSLLCKEIA